MVLGLAWHIRFWERSKDDGRRSKESVLTLVPSHIRSLCKGHSLGIFQRMQGFFVEERITGAFPNGLVTWRA